MILRRIAAAITNQNWSQVIIEIFIVVIGIFLGLQVTEWNEGRQDRIEEDRYLTRLHSEISEVIEYAERTANGRALNAQALVELSNILTGKITDIELTNIHCRAVRGSHIFVNRATPLPTMLEIYTSGKLSLIQSETIRLLMSKYSLSENDSDMLITDIRADRLVLSRKYPELITLDSNMRDMDDEDTRNDQCNFPLMIEDDSFKNDLIENESRYAAYVIRLATQVAVLKELHDALAEELDISHGEPTP